VSIKHEVEGGLCQKEVISGRVGTKGGKRLGNKERKGEPRTNSKCLYPRKTRDSSFLEQNGKKPRQGERVRIGKASKTLNIKQKSNGEGVTSSSNAKTEEFLRLEKVWA